MNYSAHNNAVFKIGVNDYAQRIVKAQLISMLKSVAQTLVSIIDNGFAQGYGTEQFPVFTANLHDATGIGVYDNGSVIHFEPTARAAEPQSFGTNNNIFGAPLLQAAITNGATQFSNGIWIVLYSTVPYAYKINEIGSKLHRGENFFGVLKQELLNNVIAGLKPINA